MSYRFPTSYTSVPLKLQTDHVTVIMRHIETTSSFEELTMSVFGTLHWNYKFCSVTYTHFAVGKPQFSSAALVALLMFQRLPQSKGCCNCDLCLSQLKFSAWLWSFLGSLRIMHRAVVRSFREKNIRPLTFFLFAPHFPLSRFNVHRFSFQKSWSVKCDVRTEPVWEAQGGNYEKKRKWN